MKLIKQISKESTIQESLNFFETNLQDCVDLAIEIQQIPAPTFSEAARADFLEEKFREIQLDDVHQDEISNVFGRIPGPGSGPPVVISSHIDTVFPQETELTVRYEKDPASGKSRIIGPGIADNALGAAGLVMLADAIRRFKLRCEADIWFVANVGEEGLGNLRGMRAIVDRFKRAAAYLIVEGGSYSNIFYQGIGVQRYQIEITTPGGHSWGDFGEPSAIHILSQVISQISEMSVPEVPKTSFNVGVIEGGTSVNTIAPSATCLLDLRSSDTTQLESMAKDIEKIVNTVGNGSSIEVSLIEIGNRPAGKLDRDSSIVTWAEGALAQVGCQKITLLAGSTDANIPISRGYPAVCIGLANAGNIHRIDEYLEPENLPKGLGQLLLLTAATAGYERKDNGL
jgi:acetylornithine deacetylase/succinyl-diaminopimelate desuccinylase-like protein